MTATEQLSTKAVTFSKKEAFALIKNIDEIYATKGRQVVHLDLRRSQPDEATLVELLIGRTGNLRAPVLRQGRILIVGFDETTYKQVFK